MVDFTAQGVTCEVIQSKFTHSYHLGVRAYARLPQECIQDVFYKVKMLLPVIFVHPAPLLKSLTFAVARLLPNGRLVARGAHDLPLGAKISNYEPEQAFKTYNSQANFLVNEWKNSLLIICFWNEHVKRDFRCSWSFLSENGLKWI